MQGLVYSSANPISKTLKGKQATIGLGQAKLRFANLPEAEKNAVFSTLFRMSLIDGRPISPIEPQENIKKAVVPLSALEKIHETVKNRGLLAENVQTDLFRAKRLAQSGIRRIDSPTGEIAAPKPGQLKPLDPDVQAQLAQEDQAQVNEQLWGGTVGQKARELRDLIIEKSGDIGAATNPLTGRLSGQLLGGIVATPVSVAESAAFIFDPKYQQWVNSGASASNKDYAGAALMLALDLGVIDGVAIAKQGVKVFKDIKAGALAGKMIDAGVAPKAAVKMADVAVEAVNRADDSVLEEAIKPYSKELADVEIHEDALSGKSGDYIQARIDATEKASRKAVDDFEDDLPVTEPVQTQNATEGLSGAKNEALPDGELATNSNQLPDELSVGGVHLETIPTDSELNRGALDKIKSAAEDPIWFHAGEKPLRPVDITLGEWARYITPGQDNITYREHRSMIEKALSDGIDVPERVLADYPDLAAKYGKPVGDNLTPTELSKNFDELPAKPKPIAAKKTRIQKALADASEERIAAYNEMMAEAKAVQSKIRKTGRSKQGGAQTILTPAKIKYFNAWVKEKGLQGAEAIERFLIHIKNDLGQNPNTWRSGLSHYFSQSSDEGFSATNKSVAAQATQINPRHKRILDTIGDSAPVPDEMVMDAAIDLVPNARIVAKDVQASGRAMSPEETIANTVRRKELLESHKSLTQKISKSIESGNEQDALAAAAQADEIEQEFIELALANKVGGAEAGRALRIRQYDLEKGWSKPEVMAEFVKKNKRLPNKEELQKIADATAEHEELTKTVKGEIEAESESAAKETLTRIKQKPVGGKKPAQPKSEEALQADIDRLAEMRAERSETYPGTALPQQEALLLKNIVDDLAHKHNDVLPLIDEVSKKTGGVYSRFQIMDAFSGRGYSKSGLVSHKGILTKEARLRSQISDAIDGIFDGKGNPKVYPKKIQDLQKQLSALRKRYRLTNRLDEAARIKGLQTQLDKANAMIASGKFKPGRPMSVEEKAVRDALTESQTYLKNRSKIADLENAIRKAHRGEYVAPAKKARSPRLIGQERRIRQLESDLTAITQPKSLIEDVVDTLQNTGTTLDNSGILRHALKLIFNPRTTGFALRRSGQSFKALVSRQVWHDLQKEIIQSPTFAIARDVGKVSMGADDVIRYNEDFRGSLPELVAKRLPWLNKGPLKKLWQSYSVINTSAKEAMDVIVTGVRKDYFDSLLAANPGATEAEIREMGRTVNVLSGRADFAAGESGAYRVLGMDVSSADRLMDNALMRSSMWSPRFAASRPQFYQLAFSRGLGGSEARKTLLAQTAATMTSLYLLAEAHPDIEFEIADTNSPDWMKMKYLPTGQTLDVWGGDLPFVRTVARIGMSSLRDVGATDTDSVSRGVIDDFTTWFKNKLGPGPQLVQSLAGYDSRGRPLLKDEDKGVVNTIASRTGAALSMLTPMSSSDIVDSFKADGSSPGSASTFSLLSLLGAGVDAPKQEESRGSGSSGIRGTSIKGSSIPGSSIKGSSIKGN